MSAVSFRLARPSAIRRDILESLRQALIEGRFEAGQEVSDTVLAAGFGVSRGPVREALLILAEEGLLEHQHNRGFRVPKLAIKDLRQIVLVREPLETRALEEARQRVTPSDIEKLTHLRAAIDAAFAAGGLQNCAVAEFDFHDAAWELSGNPWLCMALRRVCRPYFTYVSSQRLGRRNMTAGLLHEQHEQYVRYLAGDPSLTAAGCVRFHLDLAEPPAESDIAGVPVSNTGE